MFTPVGLSPNTAEARLRDAIRSVMVNRWETKVDMAKLTIILPGIFVKQTYDREIYVGPESPKKVETYVDFVLDPDNPSTPRINKSSVLDTPTNSEVASVMTLANRGFFQNNPIIITNLPKELYPYFDTGEYLSKYPNTIVEYDKEKDHYLIL